MGEYFERGHKEPPTQEEIKKALGDERFSQLEKNAASIPGVDFEAMHDTAERTHRQMDEMKDKLQSFRKDSLNSFIDEMRDLAGKFGTLAGEAAGWKNSQGVVLNKPETQGLITQALFLQDRKTDIYTRFLQSHDKFLDQESEERMLMRDGKNLQ